MTKDTVLVVGGGGREHALAWSLVQSPEVGKIIYTSENAGLAKLVGPSGEPISELVKLKTHEDIAKYSKENGVSLVVVGPEKPLVEGLVDVCESRGVRAFGPSMLASQLEGSKIYMKKALKEFGVPTADFIIGNNVKEAMDYIDSQKGRPLVIKADGLAGGKGAIVCNNPKPEENLKEQRATIESLMVERKYDGAGKKVIIEDCMVGEEASVLAFVDGKTIMTMVPTQDHKPAYDGDKGPNTGGMGAYGPAPVITGDLLRTIRKEILEPTVEGMAKRGNPFKGCLYAGLMITDEGPKVVEYNIRFGDPEAQPTLMLTKTYTYPAMQACIDGNLETTIPGGIQTNQGVATGIVMASLGYPGSYEKGKEITGLDKINDPDVFVFHAGTREEDGKILTAGGRVLCVTAVGDTFENSIKKAYDHVAKIDFEGGAMYRIDIGQKALDRMS